MEWGTEYIQTMLSPEMQAELTKYGIIIILLWARVSKKAKKTFLSMKKETHEALEQFASHFSKVESGLADVAHEMKELKDAVARDLNAHSERLGKLEDNVNRLHSRVEVLEKPNQTEG